MDAVKNFAKVEVSTGYAAGAVTVVLSGGEGAKLPDPVGDGEFNLVWWDFTNYPDPADDPNVEIVRCTARSTDTLTVTRAQEGTADTDKNTGGATYKMILSLTAKTADDLDRWTESGGKITPTDGEDVEFSGQAIFDAEVDNGNSGASKTIDWTSGNKQKVTLTGNCNFTFTDPDGPCNLVLRVIGDGNPRTPTWPASVKWVGGVAPTPTDTLNYWDVISLYYDGTNYSGAYSQNFGS